MRGRTIEEMSGAALMTENRTPQLGQKEKRRMEEPPARGAGAGGASVADLAFRGPRGRLASKRPTRECGRRWRRRCCWATTQ